MGSVTQETSQTAPAGSTNETEEPGAGPTNWAFICYSSSCRYDGAEAVGQALARELRDRPDAAVVRSGCLGLCGAGPAVVTYPSGDVHIRVTPQDAGEMAKQLTEGRGLARRSVTVPAWYRQNIVGRLGAFVDILKRRALAGTSPR
jgi:(2Fe-2S) ferredoxin